MGNCYLCNEDLTPENDHGEHIFQQALGGTLVKKGVLCESCGNRLGKEIDVPFVEIFKNYTSRLPINFDRKSENKNFTEDGDIFIPEFNRSFKFKINKNNFLPAGVDAFKHSNKLIILYPKGMPEINLEGLKKAKMKYFGIENSENVIVIRDFNSYADNGYVIPFNLDDKAYKQGMAKIAIGFAIAHGVKREELEYVLDIEHHHIKQKIPLLLYMPWNFINSAIEEVRFSSNDLRYLCHQIKLFNIEKRLFCYIEIFGTFQCYILLSENYIGQDINSSYMQPIFKLKREELPSLPRYKDLLLYSHLLSENEELDYTESTLNKINTAIRKQPNEVDFDKYYSDLINAVTMNLVLFDSKQSKHSIQYEDLKLFYEKNAELINNSEVEIYRRLYFFTLNPQEIKNDCYWESLCQLQDKYKNKIFEYNSRKMRKLEDMIKIIQDDKEHFQIWDIRYQ